MSTNKEKTIELLPATVLECLVYIFDQMEPQIWLCRDEMSQQLV